MNGEKVIMLPASTRTGVRGLRSPDDSTEKASRRRKRVTFDLDLQVHTIPNRIPIYERKPATSTLVKSQPLTFVPRPLDLHGKDRYTFGNGANGKIIDLFSPSNGFPSYSMPGSYKGVQKHWQPKKALELPTFSAPLTREPYSFSTARHQVKLSKAAASLRDITAELRDQFEQSYQPFLRDNNSKNPPSRVTSASSTHSTGSVTHGTNKQQPVFNAVAAFNNSNNKTRSNSSQGTRKNDDQKEKNTSSANSVQCSHRQRSAGAPTSGGMTTTGHALRRVPSAVTNEARNGQRRTQNSANRGKGDKHRITIDMNTVIAHFPADPPPHHKNKNTQGKCEKPSSAKSEADRSVSRCSTIDTYVISEVDYQSRPMTESMSSFPHNSRQGSSTRTIRKRVAASPNRRSIAWGLDCDDAEEAIVDINNANNLTSYQTKEVPYRLAQWRVVPRAAKLST